MKTEGAKAARILIDGRDAPMRKTTGNTEMAHRKEEAITGFSL